MPVTITAIGTATPLTPAVCQLFPATGPAAGGTTVTITGVNFTSVTAITIGGKRAASFSCSSTHHLHARHPQGDESRYEGRHLPGRVIFRR